jgi:hypothetical protein
MDRRAIRFSITSCRKDSLRGGLARNSKPAAPSETTLTCAQIYLAWSLRR